MLKQTKKYRIQKTALCEMINTSQKAS